MGAVKTVSNILEAIYRSAAVKIETREYLAACGAIHRSCFNNEAARQRSLAEFQYYFMPEGACFNQFWWGYPVVSEDDRNERVIALLLMAEMAATGDL